MKKKIPIKVLERLPELSEQYTYLRAFSKLLLKYELLDLMKNLDKYLEEEFLEVDRFKVYKITWINKE